MVASISSPFLMILSLSSLWERKVGTFVYVWSTGKCTKYILLWYIYMRVCAIWFSRFLNIKRSVVLTTPNPRFAEESWPSNCGCYASTLATALPSTYCNELWIMLHLSYIAIYDYVGMDMTRQWFSIMYSKISQAK